MKVAICMSGQLRTYKKCYENLMKYIVKPMNADIFIQVWDKVGASHKEGEIKSDEVNKKEIVEMYNPKEIVIESQPKGSSDNLYGKKVPEKLKEIEPIHYKSALSMFYQIKSCNDLAVNYAKENKFKYDIIIRIRPDTMFLQNIPKRLVRKVLKSKNVVYFVDYAIDTRFQVCDKFAFGDTEGMIDYTSVWDYIEEYWKDPIGKNPPYTHKVGERLLKYHIETRKINAKPFYMNLYTLRNSGEKLNFKGFSFQKFIKYLWID